MLRGGKVSASASVREAKAGVYLAELDALQANAQCPSLLLYRIKSLSTAGDIPLPDELARHRLLLLVHTELRLHHASLPPTATLQEFIA